MVLKDSGTLYVHITVLSEAGDKEKRREETMTSFPNKLYNRWAMPDKQKKYFLKIAA